MHNLQTLYEKKKKAIYALIIILCVIIIILNIVFSYFKDIWLDSAVILKEMESIYDGYVPYHTMHLNYPPLYFYWMAGLKWLFNIPYGCYHFYLTIQHLLLLGIGVFVYNISRSFGGNKPVSFITVCVCLMLIFRYDSTVLFEVPSLFWGLASSVIVIRCTKGRLLFFMAGLMSALSFLTKQFGAGFIVLNAFFLLFSGQKQKRVSLLFLYYGLGVLFPILVTFALFGKEFFISTLFNGYGTTNNALKGEDISFSHKIDSIVRGFFKDFSITCPIVLYVLFFPLIHKAKRWRDFLFCIFGFVGFSLQFYFVYPYAHHYFLYLAPFAALLIPIFVSIHPNKIVCAILVLCSFLTIAMCIRLLVLFPLRHTLVNIHTSKQAVRAQRIKKEISPTKTLWIANTGLQHYYYLANAATPNMAEVGYSAGPWEITIERAAMQVESADYILCYYDTAEVNNFYDYYFTEDLREFTYKHPFVDLGDNIRLYAIRNY